MPPVPARTYKNFSTRRIIIEKVIDRRLGYESVSPPPGWKWDHRYVVEDKITETLPFPGLKKSHLLGIPRTYWQNGPVAGSAGKSLNVDKIVEIFSGGRTKWVPIIHSGDINIWRDSTFFFSDDSVVELIESSSVDSGSRTTHILNKTLRSGSPVVVNIYRRDVSNEILPWKKYDRREQFSSILDSDGNEQVTRDGDVFYWDNVDTTKKEFVSYIREEKVHLRFNQNVVENITDLITPTVLSDFNDLEYVGTSDGSDSQIFETKYFPLSEDAYISIYVVNVSTSAWTEYTIVESFTAINQVIVDYDFGRLKFGSSTQAPSAGLAVYVAYRVVPRIEYEEEGFRDTALAKDADVSPTSQSINKGFVSLARTKLDITSIELSTTKPSYSGVIDSYGPVYIGADHAPILATVYSSSGEVVPNTEVTFYFETSPSFGGLGGGASSSSERRTGFDGIARTYYVPPSNIDSIGFYVSSVTGTNALTLPANALLTNAQDIYTYYVLKDDPMIGIPGADTTLGEVLWDETLFNGRKTIAYNWDASAINPISGHYGAYSPTQPASITNGNILTYTDTLSVPDPTSYGAVKTSSTVTLAGKEWITDGTQSWDTNELNNHVVYSSSLNEYRRIISNTSTRFIISGTWSGIPSGSYTIYERSANLGAYWIVSDRFISIRASAYSPRLGRTIYSNLLTLRIEIPEYMKGTYISSSLQEIPFGWRLINNTREQASAINGATYISINPVAGPYPIIDVIGGETWDPYSGYETDEAYPFWPYNNYPSEGASAPFAHFSIFWNIV